jgi:tetratricopeptide (TPR) repeat protein
MEENTRMMRVPRWFVMLAAAAFALRGLLLWQYLGSPFSRVPVSDEWDYWVYSARLASGAWLPDRVFYQGPLFPYLLALLRLAIPSLAPGGLAALQLVLNWVTCLLLLPLVRPRAGERVALAASSLALFCTPVVFFALKGVATSLGIFLTTAGLLALPREGGRWGRRCAAAGCLLGLAVLTVPSLILMLAAAAGFLLLRPAAGRGTLFHRMVPAAVLFGSALLTILPATVSNYLQDRSFILVSADFGVVFYGGNNRAAEGMYSQVDGISPLVDEERTDALARASFEAGRPLNQQEVSRHYFIKGIRFILAHPLDWLLLEMRKAAMLASGLDIPHEFSLFRERRDFLPLLWAFPVGGGAVLLLASLALADREMRRRLLLPLLAAGAVGAIGLIFYVANRFILPFLFFMLPAAGAGLLVLPSLPGRPWRMFAFLPIAAAMMFLSPFLNQTGWEAGDYLSKLLVIYSEMGDIPMVERTAERMIRLDPASAMAYGMMGEAYRRNGHPAQALRYYDLAVRLAPHDRGASFGRANLLWEMGRRGDALAALEELVREDPADPKAREMLMRYGEEIKGLK